MRYVDDTNWPMEQCLRFPYQDRTVSAHFCTQLSIALGRMTRKPSGRVPLTSTLNRLARLTNPPHPPSLALIADGPNPDRCALLHNLHAAAVYNALKGSLIALRV